MYDEINKDYNFLINLSKNEDKNENDLWKFRLNFWIKKIITNGIVDSNKLKNFRAKGISLSEMPRNPYHGKLIFENIYKFLRFPGYKRTCYHNFDKLKHNDEYHWSSFSHIGNPFYYEEDDKKFNERFLRHLRNIYLVEKFLKLDNESIIVDIGGGYGQFLCMIQNLLKNSKKILVEIPEQLLVAKFYIKKSFPYAKINNIRDVYNENFSIEDELMRNDFLLIPNTHIFKIKSIHPTLICNFNSFGEMSNDNFRSYMNSNLIKNTKYLFLINRLDSFPTYNNDISILDYKINHYKAIHFENSPIFDYYYESFSPFYIKKTPFSSRCFEYIGCK